MKKIILYVVVLQISFALKASAQGDVMAKMEDSLYVLADSIYKTPVPEMRADVNIRFGKMLVRTLEIPGSFNYPFTRLTEKIHIIYPEDKSFRIFNWVLPYTDFGRRYYAAIQMANADKLVLYPLKDVSNIHQKDAESASLTNGDWYGCEIYRIRAVTDENSRKIYMLFGYNNDGMNSSKKLVDAMAFDESGKPAFNLPIFALPTATGADDFKKRFILEYKKEIQVALNFNDELNAIVFDRLESEVNNPNLRSTYVPVGQSDGLQWTGKVWRFVQNVIQPMKLKDGQAPINGVMPGGN